MEERPVDGVEVASELEPAGQGVPEADAHIHDSDLDHVPVEVRKPVFLDPHVSLVLAVLDDVLADLGEGDDKAVDGPVVEVQVGGQDGLGPVAHLPDDEVDIVGLLDRRDLEEHVGIGAAVIAAGRVRGRMFEAEVAFRRRKEIHSFEVLEDFDGLGEDDSLPQVFEHAELTDLEKPEHAVGIDEGDVAEIDLLRTDEAQEGLLEGFFGEMGHGKFWPRICANVRE